jgi:hypothetical protein
LGLGLEKLKGEANLVGFSLGVFRELIMIFFSLLRDSYLGERLEALSFHFIEI